VGLTLSKNPARDFSFVCGGQVQQAVFRNTLDHRGSPDASLQKGVALAHIQPRGFGFPVARAAQFFCRTAIAFSASDGSVSAKSSVELNAKVTTAANTIKEGR
jgi:hypothetical protein